MQVVATLGTVVRHVRRSAPTLAVARAAVLKVAASVSLASRVPTARYSSAATAMAVARCGWHVESMQVVQVTLGRWVAGEVPGTCVCDAGWGGPATRA